MSSRRSSPGAAPRSDALHAGRHLRGRVVALHLTARRSELPARLPRHRAARPVDGDRSAGRPAATAAAHEPLRVIVALALPFFSFTVVLPSTVYDWLPENVNSLLPMYVRSACVVPELSMICSSPFVVMSVVVGDCPYVRCHPGVGPVRNDQRPPVGDLDRQVRDRRRVAEIDRGRRAARLIGRRRGALNLDGAVDRAARDTAVVERDCRAGATPPPRSTRRRSPRFSRSPSPDPDRPAHPARAPRWRRRSRSAPSRPPSPPSHRSSSASAAYRHR